MELMKPQFFNLEKDLPNGTARRDLKCQLFEELFFVEFPQWKKGMPESVEPLKQFLNGCEKESGIWVYFPWLNTAVLLPSEEIYFKLRTARNRNLISETEQKNYRNIKIGIAGLSTGSAALETLILSGGPKQLKIADPDKVETSNLNRIRATLIDVGENKAIIAAQRAWEIDPFVSIEIWENGLEKDRLNDFISGLNIFIDEMDNLKIKVLSRIACRALEVPLIMATDVGDKVVLDIERFDIDNGRPIFHGAVDIDISELDNLTREKWIELSSRIIGLNVMPVRLLQSLSEIGKTLSGAPQLGSTASLAGVAVAFAVRQMACGFPIPSGRYILDLDKNIRPL